MTKVKKSAPDSTRKRQARKAKGKSMPQRHSRRAPALAGAAVNAATGSTPAPTRPSKKTVILALIERPDGAAIGDLTAATGWQVHSVRAALTALRKEGKELVRIKDAGGVTHYRFAAGA